MIDELAAMAAGFNAAMLAGVDKLKREIGYNATRFLQMLHEMGACKPPRYFSRDLI
jgi:hypothetical protein